MTRRSMERALLKGRSWSRWSRACEVSMAVSLEMREDRGGEVSSTGSGFGVVRARATLQLFAPRSRMLGKSRFMSWLSLLVRT